MELFHIKFILRLFVAVVITAIVAYTVFVCAILLKFEFSGNSKQSARIQKSEVFSYNDVEELHLAVNDNYYSGLVAVVAGIVAIALPLSISVISASREKNYTPKELADTFFTEAAYKKMKTSVLYLAIVVMLSYFKSGSPFVFVPATALTLYVLYSFYQYMKVIESYVKDFSGMMVSKEKERLDEEY